MEIDISRIIRVLLNGWKAILITVVVAVGLAFVYTKFFVTPLYTSSGTIYVRPSDTATTTQGNITVARDLVPTYRALIDSDQVMFNVKEALEDPNRETFPKYKYSVGQIRSMKTVTAVDNTEVVKVTVTCADPHDAQLIVDQIIISAEPVITSTIRAEAFEVIDWGTLPGGPSSPNLRRNLMIAAMIGFVLSGGLLILIDMLDKRIKLQSQLADVLQVPVIGVIPSMD